MIKKHTLAMLYMLTSTMAFVLMGVSVKFLHEVPLVEKVLFRNLVSLFVAFVAIKKSGASLLGKNENQKFLISRSLLGLVGVSLIFYAISHLTLADSSIFMRLSPFWVTIFATIFLRERVLKIQIFSLILSFIGAILIIKPEFNSSLFPALVGLAASACAGGAYTLVSYLKSKEKPETIVFYFSFVSVVVTLPITICSYYMPSVNELILLLFTGIFAAIGQLTLTNAYRLARASDVSVYNYTGIIFATLLGFLFWGEIPDYYTTLGGLFIITSGYIIYKKK